MSKKPKRKEPRYDPPFEPEEKPAKSPRVKVVAAYLINPDEVNELIAASSAPYIDPPTPCPNTDYSTYTADEAASLVNGRFKPKKKKKVERSHGHE